MGVAERADDDGDWREQLEALNEELEVLNAEARELEERIGENVVSLLEDRHDGEQSGIELAAGEAEVGLLRQITAGYAGPKASSTSMMARFLRSPNVDLRLDLDDIRYNVTGKFHR